MLQRQISVYTVYGKNGTASIFKHNFDKVQEIIAISGTIHLDVFDN